MIYRKRHETKRNSLYTTNDVLEILLKRTSQYSLRLHQSWRFWVTIVCLLSPLTATRYAPNNIYPKSLPCGTPHSRPLFQRYPQPPIHIGRTRLRVLQTKKDSGSRGHEEITSRTTCLSNYLSWSRICTERTGVKLNINNSGRPPQCTNVYRREIGPIWRNIATSCIMHAVSSKAAVTGRGCIRLFLGRAGSDECW